MNCEYCGAVISGNATECPACGALLSKNNESVKKEAALPPATGLTCKHCGKVNDRESRVCINCGNRLKDQYRCVKCGKFFNEEVSFCGVCGEHVVPVDSTSISSLSRKKYLILGLTLGEFGVHFFYSKRIVLAIFMVLLGIGAIGGGAAIYREFDGRASYFKMQMDKYCRQADRIQDNATGRAMTRDEEIWYRRQRRCEEDCWEWKDKEEFRAKSLSPLPLLGVWLLGIILMFCIKTDGKGKIMR